MTGFCIGLLLTFVLGYLLGRMMAPKCPQCPIAATGSDGGASCGGGADPGVMIVKKRNSPVEAFLQAHLGP
jgi:hypothetical protein